MCTISIYPLNRRSSYFDQTRAYRSDYFEISQGDSSTSCLLCVTINRTYLCNIDHVAKKIASGCYAIKMAKHILSSENLKCLYHSLVHSHLNYGNILWGSAYQYRLNKLVKLQKKCVRNVCKTSYNENTCTLSKKLKILKLSDIFNIKIGKFMFSYTNCLLPTSIQDLFVRNSEVHTYNARHKNDPHQ